MMAAPEWDFHIVDDDPNDDTEHCGWEPADIALALVGGGPPEPELWARTDSVRLLYRGRVHAFIGEPESMKSWGWQCAALEVLRASGRVLVLDFENDVNSVVARFRDMGATGDQLVAGLVYIAPSERWSTAASDIVRWLIEHDIFDLAVIDGVTDGMGALGFEVNSNTDAAKFDRVLVKPLARTGAAVILVDHPVKDREGRGRYAIGAQHKLAAITGASFTFEVVQPFGRGQHGIARLVVQKDKPGYLRQHAAGRKVIAILHLESDPDGGVFAHIQPPEPQTAGAFRPTMLMEKVSRYVETNPGLSQRAILGAVNGKRDVVRLALELLVSERHIVIETGKNRTHQHRSQMPYRQDPGVSDDVDDDSSV